MNNTRTFDLNKDGKIEFKPDKLKKLLDDVFWEGYHARQTWSWDAPYTPGYHYNSPTITTSSWTGESHTISASSACINDSIGVTKTVTIDGKTGVKTSDGVMIHYGEGSAE